MHTIDLETPYPQLILLWPSGILFTTQAGGNLCSHPTVEGMLLPLPVDHNQGLQENALTKLAGLLDALHPGCQRSVTREEADQLDAAFVACDMPLIVNRARLQESTEAWLFVRLRDKDERWRPAESEEAIMDYIATAKKYNPRYGEETTASIRAHFDERRAGLDGLDDCASREAVLTWLNCD